MRKISLLLALIGCSVLVSESVMADEIRGRWLHTGANDFGAPYSVIVYGRRPSARNADDNRYRGLCRQLPF
jgi:hypothetical protein